MKHHDLAAYLSVMEPLPTGLSPGGDMRSPIQSVLFDVYGTLFISGSGDIGVSEGQSRPVKALQALKDAFDLPWTADQIPYQLIHAIREDHQQATSAGIAHPEVKIDAIWQKLLGWSDRDRIRRLAETYETIVNPTFPMPGLDQVIRVLRNQGLTIGIISNAQFFTPHLFKRFLGAFPEDLGFAPELTIYSYACGCAKPDMSLFNTAARRLQRRGIQPASVLYVGNDMRNDIQPAGTAGFKTALFAGDKRSLRLRGDDPELKGTTPDLVVTDLRQILALDFAGATRTGKGRPGVAE